MSFSIDRVNYVSEKTTSEHLLSGKLLNLKFKLVMRRRLLHRRMSVLDPINLYWCFQKVKIRCGAFSCTTCFDSKLRLSYQLTQA